jgi:hypothetical protein
MVYYHLQSLQNYVGDRTTGEDVLTEESGTEMPKNNSVSGDKLIVDDYYPTYEEARARLDYLLQCYNKFNMNSNLHVDLYDKVKGEHFTFDGKKT